jgi:hypothetical protein
MTPTRQRQPTAATPQRAESAYVFVRARRGADLARCFERLFVADGVCYCDAVVGDWDIVLLLQAADRRGIEALARKHLEVGEVEAFEIHCSERPWLGGDLETFIRRYERMKVVEKGAEPAGDRRKLPLLSAYAIVDVDASSLAPVYAQLYFDDDVLCCDMTDGCRTAVLLVQARTPEEMEQALSRIGARRGVLRARTLRIIPTIDGLPGLHGGWRRAVP